MVTADSPLFHRLYIPLRKQNGKEWVLLVKWKYSGIRFRPSYDLMIAIWVTMFNNENSKFCLLSVWMNKWMDENEWMMKRNECMYVSLPSTAVTKVMLYSLWGTNCIFIYYVNRSHFFKKAESEFGPQWNKPPPPPPPNKGGTAKNLYSKLERLTLSCRETWSKTVNLYSGQLMTLPRNTKTYTT
jgi:hypothetical protein